MVTSKDCIKKYGEPGVNEGKYMEVWQIPQDIQDSFSHVKFSTLGTIGFPKKIYINKDFKPILEKALRNLMERNLTKELKTWDGVYVIRSKRLSTSYSLHSWGNAVDVNAAENRQGTEGKLSEEFGKAFEDAGMDWGRRWKGKTQDDMHFQIAKI